MITQEEILEDNNLDGIGLKWENNDQLRFLVLGLLLI